MKLILPMEKARLHMHIGLGRSSGINELRAILGLKNYRVKNFLNNHPDSTQIFIDSGFCNNLQSL